MLCDHHADRPHPGDFAQLQPGNSIGAAPDDLFVIVEDLPPSTEHLVVNLPADEPGRQDWAAAITPDEVATLTRVGPDGAHTWKPNAGPEAGA